MTSAVDLPPNVRKLTALKLTRQELVTRKGVLEELLSSCGHPLSVGLSTSASLESRARSASASPWTTYPQIPQRSSSLQTYISSFPSTPCPWKDDGLQQSRERLTSNNTAISVVVPQGKPSRLHPSQTPKSHKGWFDSALKAVKLPSLRPKPLNPRPRPKRSDIKPPPGECETAATPSSNQETEVETLKPSHQEHATLNSHQETVMELAMVDVEIELVLMREWMPKLAEKKKKAKITSRARTEDEKEESGLIQRQQVEKESTRSRTLEEIGNFF